MESAKYFILVGGLLLLMAIGPGLLKKLPITSSVVYLLFGILLGSHGLNVIDLHQLEHSKLIEVISEVTVIISLFTVGLKLRLPLLDPQWRLPVSLATISMVLTVALIALVAHYFLGLGIGQSILFGAILAPTDPVLASEVQLSNPKDKNIMKFTLTSEGGMNDGTAFPFVMLGLAIMAGSNSQALYMEWLKNDLIYAVTVGLLVGAISGFIISKIAYYIKDVKKGFYLEDFLTIASIALSYGIAIQFHSYGFLAVFANALTIRQIELKESTFMAKIFRKELPDDVLTFNEQLERIFEVVSVGIVGLLIDLKSFSWDCVVVAFAIFFIIRPLAVFIGTLFFDISLKEKLFLSWFGVRGIGSIYYLYFAINHSSLINEKESLIKYTLWTIVFSIFLHGSSVKLILRRWKL